MMWFAIGELITVVIVGSFIIRSVFRRHMSCGCIVNHTVEELAQSLSGLELQTERDGGIPSGVVGSFVN